MFATSLLRAKHHSLLEGAFFPWHAFLASLRNRDPHPPSLFIVRRMQCPPIPIDIACIYGIDESRPLISPVILARVFPSKSVKGRERARA
jgi:hypothetical protein